MEELTLTTPALLFSAVSLILLAYTNRFLSYAQLVRQLRDRYVENPSDITEALAPFLKPSTKLSKQALWISKVHLFISGQIEHFWLSPADFLASFVTFFIGLSFHSA